MTLDFENVGVVEFGVGRDRKNNPHFTLASIDPDVQDALREMAERTHEKLRGMDPVPYEPSEKYESEQYVTLPTNHELATTLHSLHHATNMLFDNSVITRPSQVFCYFARFRDAHGGRLTAVKRAGSFKGLLRRRVVTFVADAMRLVRDPVFKLDEDFDLLMDDETIHILRPSGFEYVGKLREAILAAVPTNIQHLQQTLPFVEVGGIQAYAMTHPRAARYLASIRVQGRTQNIDRRGLIALCQRTGVRVTENTEGKIVVDDGNVQGFLQVLDRRRYAVELIRDLPESYLATGRRSLH